jgi:hypothetical protein
MGRKGKNRNEPQMCVYCGESRVCSDEHVVPRGFFPKDEPRPSDSVIIPVCKPCNDRKAGDDSYVRDLFAADIACDGHPVVRRVLHQQVFPSVKRGWSQFAKTAMARGSFVSVRSEGGIYLGKGYGAPVLQKRLKRFFRCVIRGLYWKTTGKRIPDTYLFDVRRIKDRYVDTLFQQIESFGGNGPYAIGDRVFGCKFLLAQEDPFATLWLFWFYERIFISVGTGPREFFEQFQGIDEDPIEFGAEI